MRRLMLCLTVALAAGLAACGGSSDKSVATSGADPTGRSGEAALLQALLTDPTAPPPPPGSLPTAPPVSPPVPPQVPPQVPQRARPLTEPLRRQADPVLPSAPVAQPAPSAPVGVSTLEPNPTAGPSVAQPVEMAPVPANTAPPEDGRDRRRRVGGRSGDPVPAPPPIQDGADLASRVGALPPQPLEVGMCAMVLFRRQVDSKPVFFSRSRNGPARMVLDGTLVELTRNAASGQDFAGIRSKQTFSYGNYTIEVDVQIEQTPRVLEGAEVPRGRLRLQDSSGWSFVIPVYGLIGCQTRQPE